MLSVVEVAHRTDTGRQREANEDSYLERSPLFAVADGMGGAQAGEVASGLAVRAFEAEPSDDESPERFLREAVERANQSIFERAQGDRSRSGMGTTLTAALLRDGEVSLGHVGDSRAYLLRDGELRQLTQDHSLVEELRRQGKLTRQQAAEHPQRSVITRALGPEAAVEVDTMTVQARDGDVFILCSDGLTTMLSDERIGSIVSSATTLERAADHLVRTANDRGGKDNITVVLFRVADERAATEAEGRTAEGATLVTSSAEAEGLDASAVAEAVERDEAAKRDRRRSGKRPAPQVAASGAGSSARSWRRRLGIAGGVLLAIGVLVLGAWLGARQVWFVGTDEAQRVALFRGLPYELPFGLELYSERYSSPVTLTTLPEERREVVTDHELRSREDAVSLIEDLQRAAEEASSDEAGRGGRGEAEGSVGGEPSAGSGGSSGAVR